MFDVAGDHQSSGIGLLLSNPGESSLGLKNHLLTDAAAVGQSDGATQIAGTPALALLLGKGGHIAIGAALLAVLHPAVLKVEFQRAHISRGDQFPRFHAEIRLNLFHQFAVLDCSNAARGAEAEVVSAERCPRQPQSQTTL